MEFAMLSAALFIACVVQSFIITKQRKALEEAGTLLDKSVAAMVELQMMLMYARIENDVLKNKVEGE